MVRGYAFPAAQLRFVCDPNRTYPRGWVRFTLGLVVHRDPLWNPNIIRVSQAMRAVEDCSDVGLGKIGHTEQGRHVANDDHLPLVS